MSSSDNVLISDSSFKENIMLSLKEKLRCSKCNRTNNPAFKSLYRCSAETHIYCQDCYDEIIVQHQNFGKECLSEEHGLCQITALDLDLLLEVFKHLPVFCNYEPSGCYEVHNEEDMEHHETQCQYRHVRCCFENCNQLVTFESLDRHLFSYHMLGLCRTFHLAKNVKFENLFTRTLYHGFDCATKINAYPFFGMWKGAFLECGRVKGDFMYRWIYLLGDKYEARKIQFKVSVKLQSQVLTWSGQVRCIDESPEEIIQSQNAFIIGTAQIQAMFDRGQKAIFEYEMDEIGHLETSELTT